MIMTKIEQARAEVRKHKFGTPEYDRAFDTMRELTVAAALAHREPYRSIDGDIWAPR